MIRQTTERAWLKFVRLYTFHAPVRKGKYRLLQLALEACRFPPKKILTTSVDGRVLEVDLTDGMSETVFFIGEYERVITEIISAIVRPGDVCLDVGANFGWYTTLLHRLVGARGAVHGFEPQPDVFLKLKQNWILSNRPNNVFLNETALGDAVKTVEIHRFKNEPTGHSSLAAHGAHEFEKFAVPMTTLDSYLEAREINQIDFVKVDVEGAELMFLNGANCLFEQKMPPLIVMEMAKATSENFGYLPNDLLEFIRAKAAYKFFVIDEINQELFEIQNFDRSDIGANVLCVPPGCAPERLAKLPFVTRSN